jgi:hypothetical protein
VHGCGDGQQIIQFGARISQKSQESLGGHGTLLANQINIVAFLDFLGGQPVNEFILWSDCDCNVLRHYGF